MARLLLGPVLRHVGRTDATVWVETDTPCDVGVLGHTARTFTAFGHHYALVIVEGMEPGSTHTYDVRLDGDPAWPERGDERPAPRIRLIGDGDAVRLAFGSCRYARRDAVGDDQHFDVDALVSLSRELAASHDDVQWPDALALLGDQVYADETTPATQQRIRAKRDIERGAREQVADFEEYTWLYHESWTDPDVRWLLSTVPSTMIFDDHDVRDDWNTSHAWRVDMQRTDWWEERIIGGLASYWIYQHLGNLAPADLRSDDLWNTVTNFADDVRDPLREFAWGADREADGAKGARWSYRRDLGPLRLLVIDSRCGRILADGRRSMISDEEMAWIEAQTADGGFDHLAIGTSLPWLLPRALSDIEGWNERLADGRHGRLIARWSEKLRRAGDLEHWAAFDRSFRWLGRLIAEVGRRDDAPATVCVLSGDVHHAYVARAHFASPLNSTVYQLTCSPLHNYVPIAMKVFFRVAWSRAAEITTRAVLTVLGRLGTLGRRGRSGPPDHDLHWTRQAGPYFGNDLMTLTVAGRAARLTVQRSGARVPGLIKVAELDLG